jgi:L-arabinonolactonase
VAVEVFSRQEDQIGEGPWWAPEEQALYWIDIACRQLYRRILAGDITAWTLPHRPGCVVGLEGGGLVLASGEGLQRFSVSTGVTTLLQRVALAPGVRFNEGKTDPSGRLWFGSMQDNFGPNDEEVALERSEGTLFRVDADGSVAIVEEGVGISNTLCWSPDERRFYFADSLANRLFAYDYEPMSGGVSGKRVFFEEAGLGIPDGSAIDVDGCLWNARWRAGMVLRITPDGRIDRRIEIPALQPSSCAFGGPRLDTLFVTSARNGMSPSALALAPLSGSVFAITGGAQGVLVPPMRWHGH